LPFDHWLRSSVNANSQVVCPILLNTECRYCHQFGHTVGRCPVILDKKNIEVVKQEVAIAPTQNLTHTFEKKKAIVNFGGFSALDSDTDEEDHDAEQNQNVKSSMISSVTPNIANTKCFPSASRPEYFTNSDEVRSLEFPRIPSASHPEYFTVSEMHIENVGFSPIILTEEMTRQATEMSEELCKLFTRGRSWAEICYELDEQEEKEEMRRKNT
jgi:hypothetical protein